MDGCNGMGVGNGKLTGEIGIERHDGGGGDSTSGWILLQVSSIQDSRKFENKWEQPWLQVE